MKDNNFLRGAAVLGIAGVIVKILGAFYRIPLGNILLDEGMGYYQTAYPFYVLLLTLSTAGFPVAIAKLVSEKRALGDYRGAFKVFKISFFTLLVVGMLSSVFVLLKGEQIVAYLENSQAYYALLGLIPALLVVPIMAAMRGFFQGHGMMEPTALSQISEQFFRVSLGLLFTYLTLDQGVAKAAGGATLGGSFGALAGTLAIGYIYLKRRPAIIAEMGSAKESQDTNLSIIKELLIIAIPITIGASIVPIMNTIDTLIVLRRLQTIGYSQVAANSLYGQLTGFAQTLINMPQVFSMAIAMSLVPAISRAKTMGDQEEVRELASSGIRITLLIGLPAAFGLFILAEPIIGLLYFKNPESVIVSVGELLKILSFSVIFLTLVQSLTAIMQGLGKPFIPVRNLFIGGFIKVILTYSLTGIESINIKGAAISTVVAYLIGAVLNIVSVKRYTGVDFRKGKIFMDPLLSALGMMFSVKLIYILFERFLGRPKLGTLVSIGIGVLVYAALLLVTGAITEEELSLLPKGEKLSKRLKKRGFLKDV